MKILYLITKSNWGGAQKYVYDLAVHFKSHRHEVAVASGGEGELVDRLKEAHIETLKISSLERDIGLLRDLKSAISIYKTIKKFKPDILHLNSSKAGGVGALCARFLGVKKIIFTIHGAPYREERFFLTRQAIYILTWITCLLSHKVITVSKQDEHEIYSMWFARKKVRTIHPGILYKSYGEKVNKKSKTVNIVTIAELHRNKGLIYALSAICYLREENFDIKYSIFGEGEERKKLEEYIHMKKLEDTITLHGHVPNAEYKLTEFDLFLLPSIKEGLPYVLLEAGRAMMPVVTTTTGGIPEIVRHEETGLLVQPKDAEHLRDELKRLIVNRNFAKKLGQALHGHVVQQFSQSKMLVETSRVYGLI